MTTIITVHGTDAGSTQKSGEQWWQRNSDFFNRCVELLDHRDDPLKWNSFVWSGKNSNRARQKASRDFAEYLNTLAANTTDDIFIISHSHGGNVVIGAEQFYNPQIYKKIKKRIFVGTAFTYSRPRGDTLFLFFWMFTFGLIAGNISFYFASAAKTTMSFFEYVTLFLSYSGITPSLIIVSLFIGMALATYVTQSIRKRLRNHRYQKLYDHAIKEEIEQNVEENFGNYLETHESYPELVIFSSEDEAINFLRGIKNAKFPVATASSIRRFAFVTSFIIYLLIIQSNWNEITNNEIYDFLSQQFIWILSGEWVVYTFLAMSLFLVPYVLAIAVGICLSNLLNWAVTTTVRSRALGNDMLVETITHVTGSPAALWRPLPGSFESELTDFVSSNAVPTLKFARQELATQGLMGGEDFAGAFHSALSWKELVHTAYHYIPSIQDLICGSVICAHSNMRDLSDEARAAKVLYLETMDQIKVPFEELDFDAIPKEEIRASPNIKYSAK